MKKEVNKKKIITLVITALVLIAIIVFLIFWFNRKFDVTVKYNNGLEDTKLKVKYLKNVDEKKLEKEVELAEHTFVGYFETYELTKEEIKSLKDNEDKNICKEKFKLNEAKDKCIAEDEFDFKNTKIKKHTTIEALWSTIIFEINPTSKVINEGDRFTIWVTLSGTDDMNVKYISENNGVATVDNDGNVTGVKKGQTNIIVESNGMKKRCTVTVNEVVPVDNGTISLRANDQCIVGNQEQVTLTASIDNALDDTVNWTLPKCFSAEKVSNTVVKLNREGRGTQCRSDEENSFTVTASLKNGNSSSLTFTYEPTLSYTVYNRGSVIEPDHQGYYNGNDIVIKTNVSAIFTAKSKWSDTSYVESATDTSVTLRSTSSSVVTIKTTCGQNASFEVYAVIN